MPPVMIQNITIIRVSDRVCKCCGQIAVTSIKPSKIAALLCQGCADRYADGVADAITLAHNLREGN